MRHSERTLYSADSVWDNWPLDRSTLPMWRTAMADDLPAGLRASNFRKFLPVMQFSAPPARDGAETPHTRSAVARAPRPFSG